MRSDAPARAAASLVSLPNEILLRVFIYLPKRTLITLSAVCHRLHQVTLPTYLSACGVDPNALQLSSNTLVFTSRWMAAMTGLMRMFTRPRVKSIRFEWRGGRPEPVIVREVYHVARWIKMLDHLEELELDFNDVGFGHLVDMRDFGIARYPLVGLHGWTKALLELMGEIARSPCQRLYIHDTYSNCWPDPIPRSSFSTNNHPTLQLPHPITHHPPRALKNIGQSFYNLFRTRSTAPIPVHVAGSAAARNRSPGLQSLQLNCACLFKSSDLIEWIISTLNQSSTTLTSLSIGNKCISTACFTAMLPLLRLPLLSDFSISSSSLEFSDLVDFLTRHPTILKLNLLDGTIRHDDSRIPYWDLPHLQKLSATPDYVELFLRGQSRGWFPELDFISIEPCPWEYDSHVENTEKALWAVGEFLNTKARKRRRLSLSITTNPRERGYPNTSISRRNSTSRPDQRLRYIDTLHFKTEHKTPLSLETLIHWLKLFPVLEHVSFTSTCLPTMNHAEQIGFVQQTSGACTHLQTVQIGSMKATVREWLEGRVAN
jgi:hypothetical protein